MRYHHPRRNRATRCSPPPGQPRPGSPRSPPSTKSTWAGLADAPQLTGPCTRGRRSPATRPQVPKPPSGANRTHAGGARLPSGVRTSAGDNNGHQRPPRPPAAAHPSSSSMSSSRLSRWGSATSCGAEDRVGRGDTPPSLRGGLAWRRVQGMARIGGGPQFPPTRLASTTSPVGASTGRSPRSSAPPR